MLRPVREIIKSPRQRRPSHHQPPGTRAVPAKLRRILRQHLLRDHARHLLRPHPVRRIDLRLRLQHRPAVRSLKHEIILTEPSPLIPQLHMLAAHQILRFRGSCQRHSLCVRPARIFKARQHLIIVPRVFDHPFPQCRILQKRILRKQRLRPI